MTTHRIFLGVLLALAVACGSPESEAPSEPVTVEPGDAGVVVTPPDEATVTSDELPEDFPSDVPRYPGAKLSALIIPKEGGGLVRFNSEDTVEDVSSFYLENLPQEGWTVEGTDEATRVIRIRASKEGRQAALVIRRREALTDITITLADPEPTSES